MTEQPEQELCANHLLFIAEWFKNGRNGTKAWKHVHGNEVDDATAAASASRLLKNDKVQRIIARKIEDINAVAEIDAVWALKKRMELVERCMQAEAVRDKEGNETGEYKFDSSGANQSLTAIEKLHLGIAEKSVEDKNLTVVIKSYKDNGTDGN